MKAKKLVLCLLLSVTLVVTFIPVISYAGEDDSHVVLFNDVDSFSDDSDGWYYAELDHATIWCSENYDSEEDCFYDYEGGTFWFYFNEFDDNWSIDEISWESTADSDVYGWAYWDDDEEMYYIDLPVKDNDYGAIIINVEFYSENDFTDFDEIVDQAKTITAGQTATVSNEGMFKFVPTVSARYSFYSSITSDADADPVGRVLDKNGNEIGSSDDANDRNFQVPFYGEKGETYYLQAINYSGEAVFGVAIDQSKVIQSVDITIKPPVCGTVVKGKDVGGSDKQTPQPEVIIPAGAMYNLDGSDDIKYALWRDAKGTFEGTIAGGQIYIAQIEIAAKTGAVFADNCQININGTIDELDKDATYCYMRVQIQAVHNWSHAVNPAPGLLKNGTQYDQCLGCGATQNAAVAPGWANYYVKGLKVAKGKGSMTVKWKKQSKNNLKKFNGYQVRYATKSDMSDAKYKTAGKGTKSKKISKLKKKTKYYVQVRTYTKTSAGTFYSKWSAKKTVKTK